MPTAGDFSLDPEVTCEAIRETGSEKNQILSGLPQAVSVIKKGREEEEEINMNWATPQVSSSDAIGIESHGRIQIDLEERKEFQGKEVQIWRTGLRSPILVLAPLSLLSV